MNHSATTRLNSVIQASEQVSKQEMTLSNPNKEALISEEKRREVRREEREDQAFDPIRLETMQSNDSFNCVGSAKCCTDSRSSSASVSISPLTQSGPDKNQVNKINACYSHPGSNIDWSLHTHSKKQKWKNCFFIHFDCQKAAASSIGNNFCFNNNYGCCQPASEPRMLNALAMTLVWLLRFPLVRFVGSFKEANCKWQLDHDSSSPILHWYR